MVKKQEKIAKRREKKQESQKHARKAHPLWTLLGVAFVLLVIIGVLMWTYYYKGDSCPKEGNERYNCLQNEAVEKKDAKVCDSIDDPVWKGLCIGEVAQMTDDMTLCQTISNVTTKDACIGAISFAKGVFDCDAFSTSGWKDRCLIKKAMDLKDESVCLGISVEMTKFKCEYDIAINTSSIDACSMIIPTEIREDCFLEVAKNKEDASACILIRNTPKKDNCFFITGFKTASPSTCEKITDSGMKSYCFLNLAVSLNESRYCDEVFLVSAHEECLKRTKKE